MTDGVFMTTKEINRTEIFLQIKNKHLKQVQAARILHLSVRQIQRLYREFKKRGAKALASKKRGRQSNHQLPPSIRSRIEELITCDLYKGFGPLFMTETLEKFHQIKVSKETTRQLMIAAGVWRGKNKKSPVIHQQRQRRVRSGELVQIDGSPHYWFEDRREPCTLIVFIDDATGQIHARFSESETTLAYMETAWEYFDKYGKPIAFYSDKHGIFRINHPNCNRKDQVTQFGRAIKELGIDLICASSPQAKGRVERVNSTLQDRLVNELRLRNISTIEEANCFLKESYLDEHNKRFSKKALSPEDAHRKIEKDLSEVLCEKHFRKVSKNLELQFDNVIYQIKLKKALIGLMGGTVEVIMKLDGSLLFKYKGVPLPVEEFLKQPHNGEVVNSKGIDYFFREKKKREVSNDHPWRKESRALTKQRCFLLGTKA